MWTSNTASNAFGPTSNWDWDGANDSTSTAEWGQTGNTVTLHAVKEEFCGSNAESLPMIQPRPTPPWPRPQHLDVPKQQRLEARWRHMPVRQPRAHRHRIRKWMTPLQHKRARRNSG